MITAEKVFTESQLNKLLKKMRIEKDKSIQAISQSHKNSPGEVRNIVDYYLFSIMANTGLRISEALNIKPEYIHVDYILIPAHISKNKKKGSVYFGKKTRKLIDEFLVIKTNLLKNPKNEYLFSLRMKPLSRSLAHMRFKYWLKQSNLPSHFSVHSLRHTYGTLCLDKGLPLTFVRDNLRHSNISITSQYLHLTKANRERVKDLF